MDQIVNPIYKWLEAGAPAIRLLAIIALMVIGALFIIPSEKTKQFAKDHIVWVILGLIFAFGAIGFVDGFMNYF